jgi:hypothetical protein
MRVPPGARHLGRGVWQGRCGQAESGRGWLRKRRLPLALGTRFGLERRFALAPGPQGRRPREPASAPWEPGAAAAHLNSLWKKRARPSSPQLRWIHLVTLNTVTTSYLPLGTWRVTRVGAWVRAG